MHFARTTTKKTCLIKSEHQAWERLFWVVSHDCPRHSQYILVYCSFHWLFSETGKSLLLNTPSTWDRTQRLLNWNYLNSSSLRTSFLVPEDTVKALKGRKQPRVLCSCDAYEQQQLAALQDNPKFEYPSGNQQFSSWI